MAPRILVIRREEIGDLVSTTPLLRALRIRFPEGHISCLVSTYAWQVLEGNPYIDAIHTYKKTRHCNSLASVFYSLCDRCCLWFKLITDRYDYVVLATTHYADKDIRLARSLLPRQVVAFVEACRTPPSGIGIAIPRGSDGRHIVEELADLGRPFGISSPPSSMQVFPNLEATNKVSMALGRAIGISAGRKIVGIPLSSRSPTRFWPPEKFVAAIRSIHARQACGFLLFSTVADTENTMAMTEALRGLPVLAYPTRELRDLIAGLSVCSSVICTEGGALHLAAALGKPIVGLYRNTPDAARWAPWQVPHVLLKSDSDSVRDISVDDVVTAHDRLHASVS